MILKEELWGGPNSPGEEGGGTLVGEAASDLLGERIRGLPSGGVSRWGGEEKQQNPQDARPTHAVTRLNGILTAFSPMLGVMTLGKLLPA